MTARRGFTLIEVMIAIVLTGVVALLVYGSAQAATDVAERLAEHRHGIQSARGMRTLLQDALRSAEAGAPGEVAFRVTHATPGGRPADWLEFSAGGQLLPLDPAYDWRLQLAPTADGLIFTARAANATGTAPVVARLEGVTGVRIETLGREDEGWSTGWDTDGLPVAVRITYWSDTGPVGVPLVVTLPDGGVT